MKATGITRRIDSLGRLGIPKEIRDTFGWEEKTQLEIFTDAGDVVVVKRYQPGCQFCGEVDDTKEFHGKLICSKCQTALVGA